MCERNSPRTLKFGDFCDMDRMIDGWNVSRKVGDETVFSSVRFWFKDQVFVDGSYMDDPSVYVTAPDDDGDCLIRFPVEAMTTFYNDEATAQIQMCMDADDELRSYAVG